MGNLDLGKSSGYLGMASNGKIDNISKEDFITRIGDISGNHEDMWRLGLNLHDEEQTTLYPDPSQCIGSQHQIYVIINNTLEKSMVKTTQLSTRKIWSEESTTEQKERQSQLSQVGKKCTSQQRNGG
jgi:hypothetical protein